MNQHIQSMGIACGGSAVQGEPDIVVPPSNFGQVEQGLYRSALPTPRNFAFVRALNISTAIILTEEKPLRSVSDFFMEHRVRVAHTGRTNWLGHVGKGGGATGGGTTGNSWKPVEDDVVKDTLELMLDGRNYPILVCDVSGVHDVGVVVACLRRLQKWNLNSVVHEYRSFITTTVKNRIVDELFIELFDIDLVSLPALADMPIWFARSALAERAEKEHFAHLTRQALVDHGGSLVHPNATTPAFQVHLFSTAAPLNSERRATSPRIQTL